VSYFLTGEHWGYDRRQGRLRRPKVNENAFLVRDEDGKLCHGLGAWEVAYRYSWVDLNDNGIDGGQTSQHTFGLNWYLQRQHAHPGELPEHPAQRHRPVVSGTVHAFGMQAQWYF